VVKRAKVLVLSDPCNPTGALVTETVFQWPGLGALPPELRARGDALPLV